MQKIYFIYADLKKKKNYYKNISKASKSLLLLKIAYHNNIIYSLLLYLNIYFVIICTIKPSFINYLIK